MDLDNQPQQTCFICGKVQSEARCLELNDHFFCGLTCKKKQQAKEDEALMQSRIRDLYG